MLPVTLWPRKGVHHRTAEEQIALSCRILSNEHEGYVYQRAAATFGDRVDVITPLDLTRNPLLQTTDRINRAHVSRPPFVYDLDPRLAALLGDASASTTVDRYATAGGRPMPTTAAQASHETQRYRIGVGYGGCAIGWSPRSALIYLEPIASCDLRLVYASDDPTEPTVIEWRRTATIDGKVRQVVAVYDLTDIDAPFYRVMDGDTDRTQEIHGETFEGGDYFWRIDGRPFHPVVVAGNTRQPWRNNALVEGSLVVPMRWSAWGSGTDHSSHPQRNVRGLELSMDTDAEAGGHGQAGIPTGSETVLRWTDIDPEKPGDHWQDSPAFDPETNGRAIRLYEQGLEAALGFPVNFEATGGDPTEQERKALEELIRGTYPECRRFDSELLRRCAATVNSLPNELLPAELRGSDYRTSPYEVLYRDEIDQVIEDPNVQHEEE